MGNQPKSFKIKNKIFLTYLSKLSSNAYNKKVIKWELTYTLKPYISATNSSDLYLEGVYMMLSSVANIIIYKHGYALR